MSLAASRRDQLTALYIHAGHGLAVARAMADDILAGRDTAACQLDDTMLDRVIAAFEHNWEGARLR